MHKNVLYGILVKLRTKIVVHFVWDTVYNAAVLKHK